MYNDNYDDYLDSMRYLMGGLQDNEKFFSDDDYPPKTTSEELLEEEVSRFVDQYLVNTDVNWNRLESDRESKVCSHSWVLYRGLNQQFEFCEKCDVKKNENQN